MAEPRRIELKPAEPPKPTIKKEKHTPSFRFSLPLTESTDKTCPEFSYAELLKNVLSEKKKDKEQLAGDWDPDDPFAAQDEAEHEKLLALAKSFDQKYGPKVGSKKKKKFCDRIEDLVDLGEGYDDTDAFIDNSEAYDEIVPACLTTQFGGFYINSGKLDFREISEDSDDDFQRAPKKKKKSRVIGSDSESEIVEGKKKRGPKVKPKKKKFKDEDGEKKPRKRKKSSIDGEKTPKKKKIDKERTKKSKLKKTSPTVAELLKQQTQSTSLHNGSFNGGEANGGDSNPENSQAAKIELSIESAINAAAGASGDGDGEAIPSLPSIPSSLADTIEKIKKAAKDSEEGKCKFFSPAVNKMLLNIETQSRQLSTGNRSSVYAHLAAYLPCGKETLIKRAKKLRQNEQDDKVRLPIQKLKEAINSAMPAQLEKYAIAQMRLQEDREKADSNGVTKEGEGVSTESDEEDKTKPTEDKKKNMAPRKKFEWSAEIRALLCRVVQVKMECFEQMKIRSQSPEEYLKAFLDEEIKTLWPKGWMQTRMLFKESRSAHSSWTNAPIKPKKNIIISTTKPMTPTTAGPSGTIPASNSSSPAVSASKPSIQNSKPLTSGVPPTLAASAEKDVKSGFHLSDILGSPVSESNDSGLDAKPTPTLLDYANRSYVASAQSKTKSDQGGAGASISLKLADLPMLKDTRASEMLKSISILSKGDKGAETTTSTLPASKPMVKSETSAARTSGFMNTFEKFAIGGREQQQPPKVVGVSSLPGGKSSSKDIHSYSSKDPTIKPAVTSGFMSSFEQFVSQESPGLTRETALSGKSPYMTSATTSKVSPGVTVKSPYTTSSGSGKAPQVVSISGKQHVVSITPVTQGSISGRSEVKNTGKSIGKSPQVGSEVKSAAISSDSQRSVRMSNAIMQGHQKSSLASDVELLEGTNINLLSAVASVAAKLPSKKPSQVSGTDLMSTPAATSSADMLRFSHTSSHRQSPTATEKAVVTSAVYNQRSNLGQVQDSARISHVTNVVNSLSSQKIPHGYSSVSGGQSSHAISKNSPTSLGHGTGSTQSSPSERANVGQSPSSGHRSTGFQRPGGQSSSPTSTRVSGGQGQKVSAVQSSPGHRTSSLQSSSAGQKASANVNSGRLSSDKQHVLVAGSGPKAAFVAKSQATGAPKYQHQLSQPGQGTSALIDWHTTELAKSLASDQHLTDMALSLASSQGMSAFSMPFPVTTTTAATNYPSLLLHHNLAAHTTSAMQLSQSPDAIITGPAESLFQPHAMPSSPRHSPLSALSLPGSLGGSASGHHTHSPQNPSQPQHRY